MVAVLPVEVDEVAGVVDAVEFEFGRVEGWFDSGVEQDVYEVVDVSMGGQSQ